MCIYRPEACHPIYSSFNFMLMFRGSSILFVITVLSVLSNYERKKSAPLCFAGGAETVKLCANCI